MVELKTDTSIDAMHAAGQVVARALTAVRQAADVGVSLLELDAVAHEVLREAGAGSPFLGYRPSFAPTPFPGVICASVNDAIVHGIPTATACGTETSSPSTAGPSWTAGRATRRSASWWAPRARPTSR